MALIIYFALLEWGSLIRRSDYDEKSRILHIESLSALLKCADKRPESNENFDSRKKEKNYSFISVQVLH